MILKKKSLINFDVILEHINTKNAYKNFFMFIMGMLVGAISVSVFYEPHDIVTSGSTGIALIITNFINIDLSLMIFTVCSILLLISFAVFLSCDIFDFVINVILAS